MSILRGTSLPVYLIISVVVALSCLTGTSDAIKCYKCKGDDECDFKTRSIYIENCTWATKCWVCIIQMMRKIFLKPKLIRICLIFKKGCQNRRPLHSRLCRRQMRYSNRSWFIYRKQMLLH